MLSRMQFKGVWRDYQSHVLGEMGEQLSNDRLHIVAAPGAGKTILGLEIIRRLGRKALVFAPTVAIRDQWVDRLSPLFLDVRPGADEVSLSLADPRQLTLATYQALDAVRRSGGLEAVVQTLNAAGPITVVLDEAHHLRREWWISLEQVVASLVDVRIVALTATPPYDASFTEWARYESLCGPIDLEIGIPELVRNGDLCPHQDHLILSTPTKDALKILDDRRRAIWHLQRDLWADAELLDELEGHPWIQTPEHHVEAILEAPEMLSAVLVLLAAAGRKLPTGPLKLLGVSRRSIPLPSFFWLEKLVDGLTGPHHATFNIGAERLRRLRHRLGQEGLIEGGRVQLRETRSIFQLMASNLAKLESLSQIAEAENAVLGETLRMVVLSEHVRAGELPIDAKAEFRPAKLGVVTIFEHLRRRGVVPHRLGVLTGTLVILPRAALPTLWALAAEHGVEPTAIRVFDLAPCPDHVRLELTGPFRARLVPLITALFARGAIQILIGTQALLGEGWDAPAVNSLILASNTASFMLSNQMRGRAIRTDPGDPGKVANIWHLATVDPATRSPITEIAERLNWGHLMDDDLAGLSDVALLRRRFRAFEGVSNGGSTAIESGFERLGFDLSEDFQRTNTTTLATAADRQGIARRWSASLGVGEARARVRESATPNYAPQHLAWDDTLQAVVWSAVSGGVFAAGEALSGVDSTQTLGVIGMGLAAAAGVAGLPKLAKAGMLIWRNGSVEGSLEQVGWVILRALAHAGLARMADVENGVFEVRSSLDGRKDIVLRGVERSTEKLVMQAITEVLGPVSNPRYLLVRRSALGWRVRTDYHAVPACLSARKDWAEHFAGLWSKRVGSSQLVFARTPEGRRVLLRARTQSLASAFQRSVDRRSAWL